MNAYEERKAARIERLRNAAAKAAAGSEAALASAKRLGDAIPFGQPILVGHHSERRHRRDIERIDQKYRKGFGLMKEAQDLERRADAAEASTAVSSDDPEAVAKLKEKLAEEKATQARNREINVTIRTAKRKAAKDGVAWEPVAVSGLVDMGLTAELATRLVTPSCIGGIGIESFTLSNQSANIRRIEKRIALLEANAAKPPREPEERGDVRVEESDNRVRVYFPKAREDIRTFLKRAGFRWAPSVGAWIARPGYHAQECAKKALEMGAPSEVVPVAGPTDREAEQLALPREERVCVCETPRPRFSQEELDGILEGQIGKPAGQYCDGCWRPYAAGGKSDITIRIRLDNDV